MLQILIFMFFVSTIRIIYKIIITQKCPSEAELKKAVLYRSDDAGTSRIIRHLGICESCRSKVDEINGNVLGNFS